MNFFKFLGIFLAVFICGYIIAANSNGYYTEVGILYSVSVIAGLISIFYFEIKEKMNKVISIIDKEKANIERNDNN